MRRNFEFVNNDDLLLFVSILKDPLFRQMYQLEIFFSREDEQRVTSLTFGRLFVSKMATNRKQGGDARSDLGG